LACDITLNVPRSVDCPFVQLPTRIPTDTSTRRLPAAPCSTRHCIPVSDTHFDASHPDWPTRTRALLQVSPTPAPYNVITTDPVVPLFAAVPKLIPPESVLNPEVKLPTRTPVVTEASRDRIAPCPDWHRTDVSDSHAVPSHKVLPNEATSVYDPSPMLPPCIDTLIDPVASRLPRRMLLALIASTDTPRLKLPPRVPIVTLICRLVFNPPSVRHTKLVSDPQLVRSHVECPILTDSDVEDPRLAPCRVMSVEPVALVFARLTTLAIILSAENTRDTLPTRIASVALAMRLVLDARPT